MHVRRSALHCMHSSFLALVLNPVLAQDTSTCSIGFLFPPALPRIERLSMNRPPLSLCPAILDSLDVAQPNRTDQSRRTRTRLAAHSTCPRENLTGPPPPPTVPSDFDCPFRLYPIADKMECLSHQGMSGRACAMRHHLSLTRSRSRGARQPENGLPNAWGPPSLCLDDQTICQSMPDEPQIREDALRFSP